MHLIPLLLLATPVIGGCLEDAFRCRNPNTPNRQHSDATKAICDDLKMDPCFCGQQVFCNPFGDAIAEFKSKCEKYDKGWYWVEWYVGTP